MYSVKDNPPGNLHYMLPKRCLNLSLKKEQFEEGLVNIEKKIKHLSENEGCSRASLIKRFKITNYCLNKILGKSFRSQSYCIRKYKKCLKFKKIHLRAQKAIIKFCKDSQEVISAKVIQEMLRE